LQIVGAYSGRPRGEPADEGRHHKNKPQNHGFLALMPARVTATIMVIAATNRAHRAHQGVAIIPSLLRTDRYKLRIVGVTHRRKRIRDLFAIQWDKRRPMPPYAESFCEALAEYMREALPITQPSESKMAASRKQPAVRKSRRQ